MIPVAHALKVENSGIVEILARKDNGIHVSRMWNHGLRDVSMFMGEQVNPLLRLFYLSMEELTRGCSQGMGFIVPSSRWILSMNWLSPGFRILLFQRVFETLSRLQSKLNCEPRIESQKSLRSSSWCAHNPLYHRWPGFVPLWQIWFRITITLEVSNSKGVPLKV